MEVMSDQHLHELHTDDAVDQEGIVSAAKNASVSRPRPNVARITASRNRPSKHRWLGTARHLVFLNQISFVRKLASHCSSQWIRLERRLAPDNEVLRVVL